jgi:hypothetical protein
MTLLETERLVRKISELLQQGDTPEIAAKLAADYVAACQGANLRLQQCEGMMKAGDSHQAIQLAETAPNLLDLVTVLEFRGSDEWRSYCHENKLPVANRIDARSIHTLNECYAQGITTDHPLYASYRSAVLNRNDEEALKILQSITRLNPTDANASSELLRLDAKVLAVRLQHLGVSLQGVETGLLVEEIETIEAVGFKNKPDGEIWRKAQAIRCGSLLTEAAKSKSASRWLDALAKLDLVHRLQNDFKVELQPDLLKELATLETWVRGEQEKDKKDREFQSLLGELHHRIHQSEEKDTSSRYVKLPELRDDYEALHKIWRTLTDFTRPIPEEAASRFRKRSALLENEIVRRTAIRQRTMLASSIAALVVGGIAVWLVLGQIKARDFVAQLEEAVIQRQERTSEKLLERVRTEEKRLLSLTRVTAAVAEAETFVSKERALLSNFETAFAKLPQQLTGEPDAARLATLAEQLATARFTLNALAPDLKTENEPRLQAFEGQWQRFLSERGTAINGLFEQWVSSAEKQSRELDYRVPLEKSTPQLAALAVLVRKITDSESGFTNQLNLRSDLLQRSATVRAKFNAYDEELKKLDRGIIAIRKARTVKEFSDGINQIASSEFSVSPAAAAGTAVQSLNLGAETPLRILLGATNAGTWAYIRKKQATGFIPELAMPGECRIFEQLNSDPAVSGNHPRPRLWLDRGGNKSVEWITAGSFETSTGWKQIKAWIPSASATVANFEDRDYGYFDGQFKLSPTQIVYRVEQLGDRNETASFNSIGMTKVWMGGTTYGKPLLEVLDSIKDSHEGSPLFRAYLFLRLVDLMNLQPDAWGLTFCPATRMHETQIKSIVGGQLSSGDWFVQTKVNSSSEKLERFFASLKNNSYSKQALGLLTLARTVSKDDLQYVGFVGLDGQSNYIDNSTGGEVWGYSASRKQLVLLSAKIEMHKRLNEQAMPLSPLFALASPCKEYLAKADVNPNDPVFQNALPPLFQKPLQP